MADGDPRWRQYVEGLRRAGFEYIPKDRLTFSPPAASNQAECVAGETFASADRPAPTNPSEKLAALKVIAGEVAGCTRCTELSSTRTQTVFSDGTPHAELCFVGEAPGADEDKQGVPFVGAAGQLLTKMIVGCKLERHEVYICNVLKCRPPGNRDPEWQEMQNCRPFLERQLDTVRPKAIVALGKYAAAFLLDQAPEKTPITKIRGQWREYRGIPVMPTLHPSYLNRNPAAKREVWEDLKEVMRFLGRPVG